MQLTSLMAHKKPKENESVTPTRPQIKTKKYEKDITNKTKSKDDKIKTKLLYLTLSQGNIRPVDQAIALDRLRFRQVPHITLIDSCLESSQIEVVPQREKHIRPAHLDPTLSLFLPRTTARAQTQDRSACCRSSACCTRTSDLARERSVSSSSHPRERSVSSPSLSATFTLSHDSSWTTIEEPKPEADDDMAKQHLDLAIPIPPPIGYLFQETR